MKERNEKDQQTIDWLSGVAYTIRYIYWIPAILLIPSAFVIYFTEGQNVAQFFSIIGFAIALTIILRWLTKYSIRTLGGAASKQMKQALEEAKKNESKKTEK